MERHHRKTFLESKSNLILSVCNIVLALGTLILALVGTITFRSSEETSERQLRAYVMVDASEIKSLSADQNFEVDIRIKNFGQTPAKKVKVGAVISFGSGPGLSKPLVELPAIIAPTNFMILSMPTNTSLSKDQFDAITSGRSAIFIKGKIEYIDAFGKNRWTEFSQFFKGNGKIQNNEIPLSSTEEGNDYD